MPAQLLVNVLTVTNLAGGATLTVTHGLASNDVSVAPTLAFPDRPTTIAVQSVSATTITFVNNGAAIASAIFRVERGWQPEVNAATVTPLLYAGATAATGLGGNILWLVVGGAYATLQDAINAAASGDTILVGPKAGGWGTGTFPAQKLLSLNGLSGAAHSTTIQVGPLAYSPGAGTIGQNQVWLDNLYVSGDFTGGSGITFAGTAPARFRATGCFVSNSGSGTGITSNNSGAGSSFYLDNCLSDQGAAGTILVHTQGYTKVQDTELHGGALAFSCAGGTLEFNQVRAEYALAAEVGRITGGTLSGEDVFIRNTTGGGSGIAVTNPGVLLLNNGVFDVAVGAGYCVSGNGTFLYGQMTFTNVAVALPRNVKTQNTLTQAQMTQSPTPSP